MNTRQLDLVAKTSGVSLKNVCKVMASLQLVSEYTNVGLEDLVYPEVLDTTPPEETQVAMVDDMYESMVKYFDECGSKDIVVSVRRMDNAMFKTLVN
jgi:hypothetical protein